MVRNQYTYYRRNSGFLFWGIEIRFTLLNFSSYHKVSTNVLSAVLQLSISTDSKSLKIGKAITEPYQNKKKRIRKDIPRQGQQNEVYLQRLNKELGPDSLQKIWN